MVPWHPELLYGEFLFLPKILTTFDFEQNFYFLYEHFNLNMTLKIHIIVHHYEHYFKNIPHCLLQQNGTFVLNSERGVYLGGTSIKY